MFLTKKRIYPKIKFFKKFKKVFLLIFFFHFSHFLYSESYSDHRVDDGKYLTGGNKIIINEGRIESALKKKDSLEEQSTQNYGITTKHYLTSKFYSQKGGDKEDLAGRYALQTNYSPELSAYSVSQNKKLLLLLSPNFSYQEDYLLKRKINRLTDLELIAASKFENKNFFINFELGRGFQRLDAYGVLFNGMANYGELNFHWKSINSSLSLLGLSYNYRHENFTIRSNNTNDKLVGGNLVFQSLFFISHLQIFNYLINEPGQIAEKNLLQEDKPFKPKGKISYSGFEVKSFKYYEKFFFEIGYFNVKGIRDYAENSYQAYNSITPINGFLSYFTLNFSIKKFDFKTGGLYATKDKSSSLNRTHNGYSTLLSEIRIFGGKSSFLLMETVNYKNGNLFREFNSSRENLYDTKGMELFSLGVSYNYSERLQFTSIFNHTVSGIGIGNEGILSSTFHLDTDQEAYKGFLLASICVAKVNPVTEKKILYDEFRVDPDKKEFTRFFISGGIYF